MEIDGGMFFDEDNDPFPEFNYTCAALRVNKHCDGSDGRFDPLLSHGSSAELLYLDVDTSSPSASPSPCSRTQPKTNPSSSEPASEPAMEDGDEDSSDEGDDTFVDISLHSEASLRHLADGPSDSDTHPTSTSEESPSKLDLPPSLPPPPSISNDGTSRPRERPHRQHEQ